MASTAETALLQREVQIDASPETVWEFLVDPEKSVRWMGMSATFDARPGGEYRCGVIPGNTASGAFVEVEAPRRLVFTWGWEPGEDGANRVPPGSSVVEIELEAEGNGTRLRLTHRDFPNAEAAKGHATGWDHYLGRLMTTAGGGDAGRDPWLDREI
jgi:uncharacterized protein YndB with AHSA1/START domain